MRIRGIMTESPATCTADISLREVAQMVVEQDCLVEPKQQTHRAPPWRTDSDSS